MPTNGGSVASRIDSNGEKESPNAHDSQHLDDERGIQRQGDDGSVQEPLEAKEVETRHSSGLAEVVKNPAVDAEAFTTMRQELDLFKNGTSVLEGALRDTRSEAQHLREVLSTERDTTQKQAAKIASLR